MVSTPRIPTDAEFAEFDRTFRFGHWRDVRSGWTCPACGRCKRELMRWNGERWTALLHAHHDHAAPAWEHAGRFEHTVICDQCNAADGQAKRQLVLPKAFTFSPGEIRQFVAARAHGSHGLRLDVAYRIFREVTQWNSAARSAGQRTCVSTSTSVAGSGSTATTATAT